MTVADALADADLAEALRLQTRIAAADPSPKQQLLLAELHVVAGEFRPAWDAFRAIESGDRAWPASRRAWLDLVRAVRRRESLRRSVHPLSADLPTHARHRIRLATHIAQGGEPDLAIRYADAADECSPELAGHVDGQEFAGLRDLDDRFASVLEVFFGRAYVVVPLERLDRIRLLPVAGVADTVYRPAELRSTDGEVWPCVLPLAYPDSCSHGETFALGMETDAIAGDAVVLVMVGGRSWYFGDNEGLLTECRQIDLRPA